MEHRPRGSSQTGGKSSPKASVEMDEAGLAKAHLNQCSMVILDFLQSKCLFAAERALRTELELVYQRGASEQKLGARNLWSSRLEKLLNAVLPRSEEMDMQRDGDDDDPLDMSLTRVGGSTAHSSSNATPTNWSRVEQLQVSAGDGGSSCRSTPSRRLGVRLHNMAPSGSEDDSQVLRRQRGRSAQQSCVVFREGLPMSDEQAKAVARLELPLLYNPYVRGLEDSPELNLDPDTLIAGRYRVVQSIGKGSFSRVVQAYDELENRSVSVKVLHNDKDCIDQARERERECNADARLADARARNARPPRAARRAWSVIPT